MEAGPAGRTPGSQGPLLRGPAGEGRLRSPLRRDPRPRRWRGAGGLRPRPGLASALKATCVGQVPPRDPRPRAASTPRPRRPRPPPTARPSPPPATRRPGARRRSRLPLCPGAPRRGEPRRPAPRHPRAGNGRATPPAARNARDRPAAFGPPRRTALGPWTPAQPLSRRRRGVPAQPRAVRPFPLRGSQAAPGPPARPRSWARAFGRLPPAGRPPSPGDPDRPLRRECGRAPTARPTRVEGPPRSDGSLREKAGTPRSTA